MAPTIRMLVLLAPLAVQAAEIPANPSNYRGLLERLAPGDTLLLASGTYTRGLPLTRTRGTPDAPIEIRGPADRSAIFKANDCCNTVQLTDVAYVAIRNLTLDGAGTAGPFGVDSRGASNDVTLENLTIRNYGANQQVVGISTKGPAWNWVIRSNMIIGAGTGMYLGDSDGSDPFVNGLIERNVVVDTRGYNLQIKHQQTRPMDVGLPTGDSRTVIRRNIWSKEHGGATGPDARPNVLVGHFPTTGPGSHDRYEIYGNVFCDNPTEALFQGEGNVVLHDNVFVNRAGSAIHIQAHNDRPRSVVVYHNTVLAAGDGISVTGADSAYEQRIVGNAVFASRPIAGPGQQENVVGDPGDAGSDLVSAPATGGPLDLHPKPGRLTGPRIDLRQFEVYLDGTVDLEGRPRSGTVRGALEGTQSGFPAPKIENVPNYPEPISQNYPLSVCIIRS